jgi:hypothetical protein
VSCTPCFTHVHVIAGFNSLLLCFRCLTPFRPLPSCPPPPLSLTTTTSSMLPLIW